MKSIIGLSIVMWILIDRFKKIWEECKYGSYITTAVALVFGIALAFTFNLDLLTSLEVVEIETFIGKVFAALALMGGSSVINEILEKLKG